MQMSTEVLIWLMAFVVVGCLAIAGAVVVAKRRRREQLRTRFGPEYDVILEKEGGDVQSAERVLRKRLQRVENRDVRELNEDEQAKLGAEWVELEQRFVDNPASTVDGAEALIVNIMRARGYAAGNFEQRCADLSVVDPNAAEHYRAAHELTTVGGDRRVTTEELRQAAVHYRALMPILLGEEPRRAVEYSPRKEVHA